MKNSPLPRPTTFLLMVALATLALLVAACGSTTIDAGSQAPQSTTATVTASGTVNGEHTSLDSVHESIDELDALLDGINSDIDSILGDLAADAAATALGGN